MKAFLDTTILVDAIFKAGEPPSVLANSAMGRYEECLLPWYAVKECEAGALGNYVFAHRLLVRFTLPEAMAHLGKLSRQKNKANTAMHALVSGMAASSVPLGRAAARYGARADTVDVMRRNTRVHLDRAVLKAAKRIRRFNATYCDKLDCLLDSPPSKNESTGAYKFATKRCDDRNVCHVARLISGNKQVLRAIRDAIIEQDRVKPKAEHKKRLNVIRGLISSPSRSLTDSQCRQLGDAVFAICAPLGTVILTTNIADHAPLAQCLGKSVQPP